MDPVSLVVSCQQELTFPHCSLAVVGEKLGTDPADRMGVVLWIVSGALLLGCSESIQIC
jgi:hypothetical protein